jgi:hypothetical protein
VLLVIQLIRFGLYRSPIAVGRGGGGILLVQMKTTLPSRRLEEGELVRARICKPFKEPRSRFPAWGPVRQPYLSYRPAGLHRLVESIPGLHERLQVRALHPVINNPVKKQDLYTVYVWRVYRNIDEIARASTLIGIFLDLAV